MVLFFHFPIAVYPFLLKAKVLGSAGVQMFYILSAFTLFLSLNFRSGQRPIASYAIKRIFRITPLFWVVICASLLVWGRAPRYWSGEEPVSTANIIAAFLLIGSASPFWLNSIVAGQWSVMVESNFYLFVPYLSKRLTTVRRALLAYAVALIASHAFRHSLGSILPGGVPADLWQGYLAFVLPTQAPVFVLGILLYCLYQGGYIANPIFHRLCVLAAILGCAFLILPDRFSAAGLNRLSRSVQVQSWVFLFVALACMKMGNSPVVRICRFAGKISYSTYLWHVPILYCAGKIFLKADITRAGDARLNTMQALTAIAVIYAVSAVSYYAVEQPGMDLGKKMIRRLRSSQADVARA